MKPSGDCIMETLSILDKYLSHEKNTTETLKENIKSLPWWLVSICLHSILLFLCTLITFKSPEIPTESKNIIEASVPPPTIKQFEQPKKEPLDDTKKVPIVTDIKEVRNMEVITLTQVEEAETPTIDTQADFNDPPEGSPDNSLLINSPVTSNTGFNPGIGIGPGGSAGPWGKRNSRGNNRTGAPNGRVPTGTTKINEVSVDIGLLWLKRHQTTDNDFGTWMEYSFVRECEDYSGPNKGGENNDKKFPGHCIQESSWTVDDMGISPHPLKENYSNAIGSLAILAYAGAGLSHKRGMFKPTVQKWLNLTMKCLDESKESGQIGEFINKERTSIFPNFIASKTKDLPYASTSNGCNKPMYQHAIMTLALNEIFGISQDKTLRNYCIESTQALLSARHSQNGLWKYNYASGNNKTYSANAGCGDMSVGTWAIMAIKAAKSTKVLEEVSKNLGITQDQVMSDIKSSLEKAMINPGGDFKYGEGGEEQKTTIHYPLGMADIAFVYHGQEMLDKLKPYVETVNKQLQLSSDEPMNSGFWGTKDAKKYSDESKAKYYYWQYYITLAMFQYGGELWEKYNKTNSTWLTTNQHKEADCSNGSWEIDQSLSRGWAGEPSRTFATALNVLQLQVYYRYEKNSKIKANNK